MLTFFCVIVLTVYICAMISITLSKEYILYGWDMGAEKDRTVKIDFTKVYPSGGIIVKKKIDYNVYY